MAGIVSDLLSQYALERVLVISALPASCIVITHSIERIHRKPMVVEPLSAEIALGNPNLVLVVLDATGEQNHIDAVFSKLQELRTCRGSALPRVLLIENAAPGDGRDTTTLPVDAVINRPITPDKIQAMVNRILKGIAAMSS